MVSRLKDATNALCRLAFTAAPAETALTAPHPLTRRIILQKARRQAGLRLGPSDGLEAHDFRVYFTPLAGVLFTVPSRYYALSVAACSLPWTVVSPASARVLRARTYSGAMAGDRGGGLRDSHALWCGFPDRFTGPPRATVTHASASVNVLQPLPGNGWRLGTRQVWAKTRFVRHYYGCGSLFLRLLRCFSWPGALRRSGILTRRMGCPIRRPPDRSLLAAPRSISERCPVLHRHAAPGHPSCAHHVFPVH